MSLNQLKQQIHHTTDAHGNPVVQIPLDAWHAYVGEAVSAESPNHEPKCDEMLPTPWWLEFEWFLNENQDQ
ncbi:MAG: hypothetical protein K8L99_22965 [Anaerolineae bacterium]|nr:hypothetical protein [Anaerolineae bacterium]